MSLNFVEEILESEHSARKGGSRDHHTPGTHGSSSDSGFTIDAKFREIRVDGVCNFARAALNVTFIAALGQTVRNVFVQVGGACANKCKVLVDELGAIGYTQVNPKWQKGIKGLGMRHTIQLSHDFNQQHILLLHVASKALVAGNSL
jgi:hypothetical protein